MSHCLELARELAEIAKRLAAVAERIAEPPAPDIQPRVPTPQAPEGDRLLDAEAVALRLGLGVAAVARRKFPFRKKLGRRTVRYSEAGLREWIERR